MGKKDRLAEKISRLLDVPTVMPVPNIGSKPHILISKVRKHYLDYVINLLYKNYEKNYKLHSKKFRLPSAIWRCANFIEMNATRSCMVLDLYRKNILVKIKELKTHNRKNQLYKMLLKYLKSPPNTDKKTQTLFNLQTFKTCNCQCTCKQTLQPSTKSVESQTKLDTSTIPVILNNLVHTDNTSNINNLHAINTSDISSEVNCNDQIEQSTPDDTININNLHAINTSDISSEFNCNDQLDQSTPDNTININNLHAINTSYISSEVNCNDQIEQSTSDNTININNLHAINTSDISSKVNCNNQIEQSTQTIIDNLYEDQNKHATNDAKPYVEQNIQTITDSAFDATSPLTAEKPCDNKSLVKQQEPEDEVMLQMEQLFRNDSNGVEDDLFEGTLYDSTNNGDVPAEVHVKNDCNKISNPKPNTNNSKENLNERIAFLQSSGALLVKTDDTIVEAKRPKISNIWLCETYFKKLRLYEKLEEIRDRNRKKHRRIEIKYLDLFGQDSDDDELMSPLNETKEFERSCKERIAPWVVKILTRHYNHGRIKGKIVFKNLVRHLLNLIYQCSRYPSEYEVYSFVADFLKTHRHIRCDADFLSYTIANI